MTADAAATGHADPDRLRRLLGGPELEWVVQRARRRLENGEALSGTIIAAAASDAERRAVERLLGRAPRRGSRVAVSLTDLDLVLRQSGASPDGLAGAVIALTGPVSLRTETRAAAEAAWSAAFGPLATTLATRPELAEWFAQLRGSGLVQRLTGSAVAATPVLSALARVVAALPADGEPLGHFAARTAGQAHDLDNGRPLAALALNAARAMTGTSRVAGAEGRRELWAAVGVLQDELSNTVLTLGLPGDGSTSTGTALATWRASGQPVVLTLRQLVRDPPDFRMLAGTVVSICENPVVVTAAAERWGSASAPLICTSGQPVAAVMTLLRSLASVGAVLRYHGDFDWGGIAIGNVLHRNLACTPWRFGCADYRTAVASRGGGGGGDTPGGFALEGAPRVASWDDELGPAMMLARRTIEEEHLVEDLVGDLGDPGQLFELVLPAKDH